MAEMWQYCEDCNISFDEQIKYYIHLKGLAHIMNSSKQEFNQQNGPDTVTNQQSPSNKSYFTEQNVAVAQKRPKWRPAREKDFKPDELGKTPPAYRCETCNVSCTGQKTLAAHMEGQRHKKKMNTLEEYKKKGTSCDRRLPQPVKQRAHLQVALDCNSEPLIGVDLVTEFQRSDVSEVAPRYVCDLCHSKMDVNQVIDHLEGVKHRMKYIMLYYYPMYKDLKISCRSKREKNELARKMAAIIETHEGRFSLRLKVCAVTTEDPQDDDAVVWVEIQQDFTRSDKELISAQNKGTLSDSKNKTAEVKAKVCVRKSEEVNVNKDVAMNSSKQLDRNGKPRDGSNNTSDMPKGVIHRNVDNDVVDIKTSDDSVIMFSDTTIVDSDDNYVANDNATTKSDNQRKTEGLQAQDPENKRQDLKEKELDPNDKIHDLKEKGQDPNGKRPDLKDSEQDPNDKKQDLKDKGQDPNKKQDPEDSQQDPNDKKQDPNDKGLDPNDKQDLNDKKQDLNDKKQDPNDKGLEPNDKKQDPNDKRLDPNDKKQDPNYTKQDPNDKKQVLNDKKQNPNDKGLDPNDKKEDPNDKRLDPNDKGQDPKDRETDSQVEMETHNDESDIRENTEEITDINDVYVNDDSLEIIEVRNDQKMDVSTEEVSDDAKEKKESLNSNDNLQITDDMTKDRVSTDSAIDGMSQQQSYVENTEASEDRSHVFTDAGHQNNDESKREIEDLNENEKIGQGVAEDVIEIRADEPMTENSTEESLDKREVEKGNVDASMDERTVRNNEPDQNACEDTSDSDLRGLLDMTIEQLQQKYFKDTEDEVPTIPESKSKLWRSKKIRYENKQKPSPPAQPCHIHSKKSRSSTEQSPRPQYHMKSNVNHARCRSRSPMERRHYSRPSSSSSPERGSYKGRRRRSHRYSRTPSPRRKRRRRSGGHRGHSKHSRSRSPRRCSSDSRSRSDSRSSYSSYSSDYDSGSDEAKSDTKSRHTAAERARNDSINSDNSDLIRSQVIQQIREEKMKKSKKSSGIVFAGIPQTQNKPVAKEKEALWDGYSYLSSVAASNRDLNHDYLKAYLKASSSGASKISSNVDGTNQSNLKKCSSSSEQVATNFITKSTKQVGNMISPTTRCRLSSEGDANVALQLTHELTKALFQYRIKTISENISKHTQVLKSLSSCNKGTVDDQHKRPKITENHQTALSSNKACASTYRQNVPSSSRHSTYSQSNQNRHTQANLVNQQTGPLYSTHASHANYPPMQLPTSYQQMAPQSQYQQGQRSNLMNTYNVPQEGLHTNQVQIGKRFPMPYQQNDARVPPVNMVNTNNNKMALDNSMLRLQDGGMIRQQDGGMLHQQDSGMLRQQDCGMLRQQDSGMLRQKDCSMLRQQNSGVLRQQDSGMLHQQDSGMLRQQDSGMLHQQNSGMLHQQDGNMLRQPDGGTLRQHDSGMLRQQDSGMLRQQDSGMLHQQDSGMLHQQDGGMLCQQNSGMLHQHDSSMLHQQDSGMLRQQDGNMLNQQDSGMLRQQDSGMLRQQDSGMLRQQDSGMLRQQDGGMLRQQRVDQYHQYDPRIFRCQSNYQTTHINSISGYQTQSRHGNQPYEWKRDRHQQTQAPYNYHNPTRNGL